MRSVSRLAIMLATPPLLRGEVHVRAGSGSATLGGFGLPNTALRGELDEVRVQLLDRSMPCLMSRMALTSSTRPLSQELPTISRLTSGQRSGSCDLTRVLGVWQPATLTSMNVRRHLFLQK